MVATKQSTPSSSGVMISTGSPAAGRQVHHNRAPPPAESTPTENKKDDLDIIISHKDFPSLVALATKVKAMREAIAGDHLPRRADEEAPKSALQIGDVLAVVHRLKQRLLSMKSVHFTIERGVYPVTDSLLDDSFTLLQLEFERCQQWLEQYPKSKSQTRTSPEQPQPTKRHKGESGEAIAVKYSKWQTDILMNWMVKNKSQPFPNAQQIKELMEETQLSQTQVVNWTTNVRKRNRKATCVGGKKPHHFIDFLFLAEDRDKNCQRKGRLPVPVTPASTSSGLRQKKKTSQTDHGIDPHSPVSAPHSQQGYPQRTHSPQRQHQVHPHSPYPPSTCAPVMRQYQAGYPSYPGGFPLHPTHSLPAPYSFNLQQQYHPRNTHAKAEDSSWQIKLKTVTESFDDASFEPISADDQIDNSVLNDFADFWTTGERSKQASASLLFSTTALSGPPRDSPRHIDPDSLEPLSEPTVADLCDLINTHTDTSRPENHRQAEDNLIRGAGSFDMDLSDISDMDFETLAEELGVSFAQI